MLGIDLSGKMIEEAKIRNAAEPIEYRVCGIEEYEYPENTWDCVVSNLSLHYIREIEGIFRKVYRTLRRDGVFLLNIEHPAGRQHLSSQQNGEEGIRIKGSAEAAFL